MSSSLSRPTRPGRRIGATGVCASGVALVLSASTLATDLTGVALLGGWYLIALVVGLLIVGSVTVSTCQLALRHRRAGGIYQYARAVLPAAHGQSVGLFLALLFFATFLTAAAAETKVTAELLRGALHSSWPVEVFVVGIGLCALVPNLCGLRCAAGLTAALLVVMLAVRWGFGLAGFFGWSSAAADWDLAHLLTRPSADGAWQGLLGPALALGFWTFVGLEGSCALVEDVRSPERALPRGLVAAALVILSTSVVLTLGLGGAVSGAQWAQLIERTTSTGESLTLQVGASVFGAPGTLAMTIAAFASTTSTLLIALAAVPRMIVGLARDDLCFGPRFSQVLRQLHPRSGAPISATLVVGGLYLGFAVGGGSSLHGVLAAAYLYFFRYAAVHVLALIDRRGRGRRTGAREASRQIVMIGGLLGTLLLWPIAFQGEHARHGTLAGVVAVVVAALALVSWSMRRLQPSVGGLTDVGEASLQQSG